MKFSTIAAIILGAASATVFADVNFFDAPRRGSVFSIDDSITFVVDEVSNDYDDTLKATLYSAEDGSLVEELGEWTGKDISGGDNFVFTWDVDVGVGRYYVRIFEIDGDNEHGNDQDDITRSHIFTIGNYARDQSATDRKAYSAYSANVRKEAKEAASATAASITSDKKIAKEASVKSDEEAAEEASVEDKEEKKVAKEASSDKNDKKIAKEASTDKDDKIVAKEASSNKDDKKLAKEASVDNEKKIAASTRRKRSIYSS